MRRLVRPVRYLTRPLLLVILLVNSGCVSVAYREDPLEQQMINQQPELALTTLEQLEHKARNQALYHLDKAVLLRMKGDFENSNAELELAKQISAQLEAVSLREQAAAVTVNDIMRSYLPPPFEGAMLYCFKILNYLELNDIDGARVEALQLDVYLKQHYKEQEPAFARYLNGLVFEADRELSDAMISYRKAYEAYQAAKLKIPKQLQADLLRLTDYLGLDDEHQRYLEEFQLKTWPNQAELNKQGEVIVIVFSGLVPRKHETAINAQDPRSGQLHRVAIPFYEQRKVQVDNLTVASTNQQEKGELFAQIDQQAFASLNDQMPGIIARAIARVSVKNQLSDNVAHQNELLGVITNLAGFISEQADTRGWDTLPQQILLSRIALPPGQHDIDITLKSGTQTEIASKQLKVSLQAEQKQFYSWHWPASTVTSREHDHANTNFSTTIYYRAP